MIKYKIKRFSSLHQKTIRIYHTTRLENLDSILKNGLQIKYQKDREFENKTLKLGLMKTPMVYCSKSLEHLCIPAVENKRVVLQIDVPKNKYLEWDRKNLGDPQYQYFSKNKSKFHGSWEEYIKFMTIEMCKQDPKLDSKVKEEIKQYGSLEETPRFIHGVNSLHAMTPDACLMVPENIPPEWICSKILTERDLYRKNIFFGRKQYSILDTLAGRKVLYHGTSDEGAESIRKEGLKHSYYNHSSNNTLRKLEKHKNGTLNPMLEKLMDFEHPENYNDLVYMTADKNSADFMANVNKRKGRGGQTLKISIPYKAHRHMKPVSNPEYQQAAHIHDDDGMSRCLLGKPYREGTKEEKKNIHSFVKAKNADFILRGEDIPSKYIEGGKGYKRPGLKEIWDYQTRKFSLIDKLAGREVYYHGTSKGKAKSIKENGLHGGIGSNTKSSIKEWDGNPNDYSGKLYLHKNKKWAEGFGSEVIEAHVPYEVHKSWKRGKNPERDLTNLNHLKTKDDFAREHLGKPWSDLNKKEKEGIKNAVDYANSEYILDNGNIPSKYIKGSKDYKSPSLKEIWDYQTRKFSNIKGFYIKDLFHPRTPDKELTNKVKDLGLSVSTFSKIFDEPKYNRKANIIYYDIWLNEDPTKFIWLGDDRDSKMYPRKGFVVHFKTGDDLSHPTKNVLSDQQKDRLFKGLSRIMPRGGILGTYGTITRGGISAFNKLQNYGFKVDGYWDHCLLLPERKEEVSVPILKKK